MIKYIWQRSINSLTVLMDGNFTDIFQTFDTNMKSTIILQSFFSCALGNINNQLYILEWRLFLSDQLLESRIGPI